MGYDTNRFVENTSEFRCPICQDVLEDPIKNPKCEHIFCRSCIKKWISKSSTCPVDREKMSMSKLVEPSRFFRNQYNYLKIKCKNDEAGCKETIQLEDLMKHEMNCQFMISTSELQPGGLVEKLHVSKGHKMLLESLKTAGVLKSRKVENAMLAVDRSLFLTTSNPFDDQAESIGYGATISAPHIHASILELLKSKITPKAKILDIGSGSGYLTICMALMLGKGGKVIGIDHIKQLIEQSTSIVNQHFSYIKKSRIEFETVDGRNGYESKGPYDIIHIGGVMDEVPKLILNQLKLNGRIVVPLRCIGGQKITTIDKASSGEITKKIRMGVKCEPITHLRLQMLKF